MAKIAQFFLPRVRKLLDSSFSFFLSFFSRFLPALRIPLMALIFRDGTRKFAIKKTKSTESSEGGWGGKKLRAPTENRIYISEIFAQRSDN